MRGKTNMGMWEELNKKGDRIWTGGAEIENKTLFPL